MIVTILSDLNIPTCALKLIISYLSERSMCVRYNGATSSAQSSPGGSPQGGLISVILFNLQANKAGTPCAQPKTLPPTIEGPEPLIIEPAPPCHQTHRTHRNKFVDDLTLLEKIDLKSTLVIGDPMIGPKNFHE